MDWSLGIEVSLIGFSVVILALVILYGIMVAFSSVLNPQTKTDASKDQQEEKSQPATESSAEVEDQQAEGQIDPKVMAAITASVTAAMGGSGKGFRIAGVYPIERSQTPLWKFMGRKQLMESEPKRS